MERAERRHRELTLELLAHPELPDAEWHRLNRAATLELAHYHKAKRAADELVQKTARQISRAETRPKRRATSSRARPAKKAGRPRGRPAKKGGRRG